MYAGGYKSAMSTNQEPAYVRLVTEVLPKWYLVPKRDFKSSSMYRGAENCNITELHNEKIELCSSLTKSYIDLRPPTMVKKLLDGS